ncbi:MAG: hypothetical protein NTU79_01055 [Planctomycetota bacterium]|nr:hypothetical protein [Planctomycetota bacterium]
MTTAHENERHILIRRIFEELDSREQNEAQDILDAFHTVWDKLFYLGENLESAATKFDGKEKSLLLEEYRRMQMAIAIVGESYIPVIMPDDSTVGP